MKRYLIKFTVGFLFFLMLLFPDKTFSGASRGLLLWFKTVLPTLLPFIIFSNLLLHTHTIDLIVRLTGPLFMRLFHVSSYGSFAILTGFLCGYPMGSKTTADLLKKGYISNSEASYLLSFCNNTSPIFIISFIVLQNLKNPAFTGPALLVLILTPLLLSFFFRRKTTPIHLTLAHHKIPNDDIQNNFIDTCIMNGFETITKVGGYIMLFSIFLEFMSALPVTNAFFQYIFLPSLEITNGIVILCESPIPSDLKYLLCMMHTAFGGWCSIAQTKCMISDTPLSIKPYITEKLITATVTSILAYICIAYI